jgi:hypothetical protein
MAWTKLQKQIAVRACNAARISEEQRRDVILRHFAHAKLPDGRISSTAPKLSNEDFEQFMAIVEAHGGGQVLHFSRGYFKAKAEDRYARMRRRIYFIAQRLEAAGALHANGAGLSGWITKRVTHGQCDRLEELDYHGLLALMLSLIAYAHQRGVTIDANKDVSEPSPGMESLECATH